MSWRTGKNIIHDQNSFLCYCPLAKLSILVGNLGWRLTLEKKKSNCPENLLSSSKDFHAFGWIINSWFASKNILCTTTMELVKTPSLTRNFFLIFFFNIQLWGSQNRMEKSTVYIRNKASWTYLNDVLLMGFSSPNLFMKIH